MAQLISSASELASHLSSRPQCQLLDVRLAEDFAVAHLPGAINQCVFEVVFLEELAARISAKEQPLCVYGACADSHESRVAAEKLERAGYSEVYDFRGGLEDWRNAGMPLEHGSESAAQPGLMDGVYALDLNESRVEWIGRNLINKHSGSVALGSGTVEMQNGVVRRGEAVLDMRRITCSDLAGNPLHDVLIHHLQSDDFFDVERFPTARFAFDHAEVCSPSPGCRNLRLHGELALRGTTKPLVIEASAGVTADGRGALQAVLLLDRTQWGVIYGSGRFFRRLMGHLVNDEIEIQLRLVTEDRADEGASSL